MACGATILASDTAPVLEMISPGETGLTNDFFDVEGMAEKMNAVLNKPDDYRHLGHNASRLVQENYSLDYCLPQLRDFYAEVATGQASQISE
jgi:glycosyltransferase involved in cell wall biosynthesis